MKTRIKINQDGDELEGFFYPLSDLPMAAELAAANETIRKIKVELSEARERASMLQATEKFGGNAVKEEYWTGELAVIKRIELRCGLTLEAHDEHQDGG